MTETRNQVYVSFCCNVSYLVKLLIIIALHICIDTADDIEDHTDYDDETRTRDEEVDLSRTRE